MINGTWNFTTLRVNLNVFVIIACQHDTSTVELIKVSGDDIIFLGEDTTPLHQCKAWYPSSLEAINPIARAKIRKLCSAFPASGRKRSDVCG